MSKALFASCHTPMLRNYAGFASTFRSECTTTRHSYRMCTNWSNTWEVRRLWFVGGDDWDCEVGETKKVVGILTQRRGMRPERGFVGNEAHGWHPRRSFFFVASSDKAFASCHVCFASLCDALQRRCYFYVQPCDGFAFSDPRPPWSVTSPSKSPVDVESRAPLFYIFRLDKLHVFLGGLGRIIWGTSTFLKLEFKRSFYLLLLLFHDVWGWRMRA